MAIAAQKLNPNNQAASFAAAQVARLDPTSPDYLSRVFELVGQYQADPNAVAQAIADLEYKQAQTGLTNANAAQVRKETSLLGFPKPEDAQKLLEAQNVSASAEAKKLEALTLAQELRRSDAIGKGSAVGASFAKLVPFGQTLGLQGKRSAFEARVDTLKANLTLDNLKLLKGAMSDKDLLFLNSIGSSLTTSMSEAEFNKELDRVIQRLSDTQVVNGVTYKKGSDGLYYQQ